MTILKNIYNMKLPQIPAVIIALSAFAPLVSAGYSNGQFWCYDALSIEERKYVEQDLYIMQKNNLEYTVQLTDFAGPKDWVYGCVDGELYPAKNCILDSQKTLGYCYWGQALTKDHEFFELGAKLSLDYCARETGRRKGFDKIIKERFDEYRENKERLLEGKLPKWIDSKDTYKKAVKWWEKEASEKSAQREGKPITRRSPRRGLRSTAV